MTTDPHCLRFCACPLTTICKPPQIKTVSSFLVTGWDAQSSGNFESPSVHDPG